MNMFKPLKMPEIENGFSIHAGKWFVFIDKADGRYHDTDDCNFLHRNGKRLVNLKENDADNVHIMFDTEADAYDKSLHFYIMHGKELEFPWVMELSVAVQAELSRGAGGAESQVMEFE